jgi:hypothetical protein
VPKSPESRLADPALAERIAAAGHPEIAVGSCKAMRDNAFAG